MIIHINHHHLIAVTIASLQCATRNQEQLMAIFCARMVMRVAASVNKRRRHESK